MHSLSEFVGAQTRWDEKVSISTTRLVPYYTDGCTDAMESESLSEQGPGAYQQVTACYCDLGGVPIAIQLVNWRGDPHLVEYRQILLRVAESLRPSKKPENPGPATPPVRVR